MSLGLGRAAIFVQGEVKQSIAGNRPEKQSVDTGRFLNSIGVSKTKNDAVVSSELSYARKLEDGFSNFKGRNHFKNTKARTKHKVKEILQKEINKAMK